MELHLGPESPPLDWESETGTARLRRSRLTLDLFVSAMRRGLSARGIAKQLGVPSIADVHSLMSYCLRHAAEVDAYLDRRDREANELRAAVEARRGPNPSRAELRKRRVSWQTSDRSHGLRSACPTAC